MKRLNLILSLMLVLGLAVITSCKKDEDPTFTLVSLTAGDIDLAGVTAAADVPEDAVIQAVFSSEIDAATATTTTFAITFTDDGSAVDYTVAVDGATVTLTPSNGWPGGSQFTIALAATIAGTNGAAYEGNSLSFRTSGIFVPQKDYQVLYLSFDEGTAEDEAGDHTVTTVETLTYETDRRGTANAAAYFNGQGNLVEVAADDDLISSSITISFWFKTDIDDYNGQASSGNPQTRFVMGLGVENGYFLEMGRRSNDPTSEAYDEIFLKMATDHVNVGTNAESNPKATAWTEVNSQLSVNYVDGTSSGWSYAIDNLTESTPDRAYINEQIMGQWTHFVMTVNAATQEKTIYINGIKWASYRWISSGAEWLLADLSLKTENNDGSALAGIEGSLALGFIGSSSNEATSWAVYDDFVGATDEGKKFFKGSLDQFRIFSVPFTDSEVGQLYDNEK